MHDSLFILYFAYIELFSNSYVHKMPFTLTCACKENNPAHHFVQTWARRVICHSLCTKRTAGRDLSTRSRESSMQPWLATVTSFSGSRYEWPSNMWKNCHSLYRNVPAADPSRIGCRASHIFIENIGGKLNLTPKYVRPDFAMEYGENFLFKSPHHFAGVAVLDNLIWNHLVVGLQHEPIDRVVTILLRDVQNWKFLYCTLADLISFMKVYNSGFVITPILIFIHFIRPTTNIANFGFYYFGVYHWTGYLFAIYLSWLCSSSSTISFLNVGVFFVGAITRREVWLLNYPDALRLMFYK